MAHEMAEARVRVTLRPWRVGLLVDTNSNAAVREAISNLSSVWGGVYMPILDAGAPVAEIEVVAGAFDVDSLYAESPEGPLDDLLKAPGWSWRGRGEHGPFGSALDGAFRRGLLPAGALLEPDVHLALPAWDPADPADLALSAVWGIAGDLEGRGEPIPVGDHPVPSAAPRRLVGAINATRLHLGLRRFRGEGIDDALFVLHPDRPKDVVAFWNSRACGDRVIGVPAHGAPEIVGGLLSGPLPECELTSGSGESRRVLRVIGLDHASAEVADLVSAAAERDGLSVEGDHTMLGPHFLFPGLDTAFTRSSRVEFRSSAHWLEVTLPPLPLVDDPNSYPFARGCVAAEVKVSGVQGQDPRFTLQAPPHRNMAEVLDRHVPFMDGVEHARAGFGGLVFGIDAEAEDLRLPSLYRIDVMRSLFGDKTATAEQSDVGKFQTRAAEKFGGPYSGVFNQPGIRAAVTLAASRAAGVPLEHLREVVRRDRGGWPDAVMEHRTSPREYAIRSVNYLFHSGLFVPISRVHCSHCRVETHVAADELASTMRCEFCGDSFNLALSHGLAGSEWRYRLAGHLRADQIGPLLPVLATTSLLQQLRHDEDPSPLVLGLKMLLGGRQVEIDVATYVRAEERTAILGEVKTGSRIDGNDIDNLSFLQDRLRAQRVRSLLLFATLKDRFSPEEVALLRGAVNRAAEVETTRGQFLPNVPLVLTGPDLSHHYWDKDHPWRWDTAYAGLFGTAIESCKRNLGLIDYAHHSDFAGREFAFQWQR